MFASCTKLSVYKIFDYLYCYQHIKLMILIHWQKNGSLLQIKQIEINEINAAITEMNSHEETASKSGVNPQWMMVKNSW